MKFAAQERLVPGESFKQKADCLSALGYEGIELSGERLSERIVEIKSVLHDSPIQATSICGGYKFGLLFPDKADRDQSREEIKHLLTLAGEVGAQGVIVVPIFGESRVPDLSPWKTTMEIQEALLVEQLYELATYAGEQGTQVIVEPLNRYETHYIQTLQQASTICEQVNSKHMTILADFFHMNIEEQDMTKAITETQRWVGYVHLADSNRLQPGFGHTDFRSGFQALQEIQYDGWLSLECSVQGEAKTGLQKTLEYLKSCSPYNRV